ncbi:MAG TPA: L-arabinose isomerase [Candidatus Marinimicrobia bacterium]|nr:L-arabinose isomerase [Candidatus Neomarinimicrobiota bacterium]HRS51518.1 L-arabinose isomerase [Candidatus Neomarinimicrobiota bacterium]HRU92896.1 L-arabinose isomerase [Candidatus Neomarinimicrobiota bacterium]
MKVFENYEVWFVTGSQHLYGEDVLRQVADHSREMAKYLSNSPAIPVKVIFKSVLTEPEAILNLALEANSTRNCIGLIVWMHTFSPAKMWIAGLKNLQKPFVHLHTQYNRDLPWSEIDMDFMNLNQSAHGDREFGFICSRMKINRKVIVGHWCDENIVHELAIWARAAVAWQDSRTGKIARFGDNMREVAVTEGDKVEAQIRFGYSVNGYGIGDLAQVVQSISESDIDKLITEYNAKYIVAREAVKGGEKYDALREAARIELGLRQFLKCDNFTSFTTTFEDLHGLKQLPGLAVQRLMAEGYGFGAEGDWKTAALVRAMKIMATGLPGGTSFMEDYTYHFNPSGMKVLGAHMLEVCESVAASKPRLEVHPLSIGGKADPPRLVFNAPTGPALNVSLIDLGNRFRMILNEVESVQPDADLPKLPVARVVWMPKPNLKTAAQCWILAGGAHHTGFSQALTAEYLRDFAEIAGIELVEINNDTNVTEFKKELRWNEVVF